MRDNMDDVDACRPGLGVVPVFGKADIAGAASVQHIGAGRF